MINALRRVILPEIHVLTEDVAEKILCDGRIEDLLEYNKIECKAAEVLAKYDGLLTFSAICGNGWNDGLPDEIAHALARHKGGVIIKYLTFLGDSSGHVALAKTFANNEGVLDLRHVRELSSLAADALSQHKGGIILTGLHTLSDSPGHVALAKTLAENMGVLDLSDLRELGDLAADALAQHKGGIILKGLRSLKDSPGHAALAEAIADIEGVLDLSKFEELGDSAANALAKHKGGINVSGLRKLNDSSGHIALAKTLAEYKGVLDLSRLEFLGDAVAKELSNHRGGINLSGLRELTNSSGHVALAKALTENEAVLSFCGLNNLGDSAAEELAKHRGGLKLPCLRNLTGSSGHVALAKTLAENEGVLNLGGLEHLDDAAAEELAKHRGGLKLSCLRSLTGSSGHVALAKILAENEGALDIRGLEHLDDAAAEELAKHRGGLILPDLRSLTDSPAHVSLAKMLAENEGVLDLRGVEYLGDAAAEELAKHRGGLNLSGLRSLTDSPGHIELAKMLASGRDIDLGRLEYLGHEAAGMLAKHKGCIILNSLKSLTDAAAMALTNRSHSYLSNINRAFVCIVSRLVGEREATIFLNGLTVLSDSAANVMAKYNGHIYVSNLCDLSGSPGHLALQRKINKQEKMLSNYYKKSKIKTCIRY